MTELLLRDVEVAPDGLEARAAVSDRLRRLFAEEVRGLTVGLLGSAELFGRVWLNCVREVARGETALVHSLRGRFEAAFERRLALLQRAKELATGALESDPALEADLAGMERFRERVLDPWKTSDDLEELAARDFPLPQARLRDLARQHPPPQAWYDEENKPF